MGEDYFDQTVLNGKIAFLESQLSDKQKEVDYYRKVAREVGHKRLVEVHQMYQMIEERNTAERKLEKVIEELQEALEEVRTLQGFLPICASCKKIRDDRGYWNQIEQYIQEHSAVKFTHGLCPECIEKYYGKEDWCDQGNFIVSEE